MFARFKTFFLLQTLLTLPILAAALPIWARLNAAVADNDRGTASLQRQRDVVTRNRAAAAVQQRWSIVVRDRAARNYVKVLNDIQTFIRYVQTQPRSHITPSFARTLQHNALRIFHKMLVKAKASGQLDSAGVDSEYAYYRNWLASLNGSPRPHP